MPYAAKKLIVWEMLLLKYYYKLTVGAAFRTIKVNQARDGDEIMFMEIYPTEAGPRPVAPVCTSGAYTIGDACKQGIGYVEA